MNVLFGPRRAASPLRLAARPGRDGFNMNIKTKRASEEGRVGWILLWLLGVPLPILLILFLLRGCT